MYQGYRIKINGKILDNQMIVRGSYSSQPKQRVIAEYYDQLGVRHEELSPRTTVTISFTICEHDLKEHEEIMKFLEVENHVEVEYWDDKKMAYALGDFKIENYKFDHKNAFKNDIRYKDTPITLREY